MFLLEATQRLPAYTRGYAHVEAPKNKQDHPSTYEAFIGGRCCLQQVISEHLGGS